MDGYKLVDRLAMMDCPAAAFPPPSTADELLDSLVNGSDPQGRYYASARLIRRLFWEEPPSPDLIVRLMDELISRGDVEVRPDGISSYGGGPVEILYIKHRQRFDRFKSRPAIPMKLRQAVYDRDGWLCVSCGSGEDLSLDHIHPYSLGGLDVLDNLQTMCRPCNSRKGARV